MERCATGGAVSYRPEPRQGLPKRTAFRNGELENAAGQNNGSCKLFAFARLQGLSKEQTLACFGAYYRNDVLGNPTGTDHQNIRNFMQYDWDGIAYAESALRRR